MAPELILVLVMVTGLVAVMLLALDRYVKRRSGGCVVSMRSKNAAKLS